jgi:hypothetical protein
MMLPVLPLSFSPTKDLCLSLCTMPAQVLATSRTVKQVAEQWDHGGFDPGHATGQPVQSLDADRRDAHRRTDPDHDADRLDQAGDHHPVGLLQIELQQGQVQPDQDDGDENRPVQLVDQLLVEAGRGATGNPLQRATQQDVGEFAYQERACDPQQRAHRENGEYGGGDGLELFHWDGLLDR